MSLELPAAARLPMAWGSLLISLGGAWSLACGEADGSTPADGSPGSGGASTSGASDPAVVGSLATGTGGGSPVGGISTTDGSNGVGGGPSAGASVSTTGAASTTGAGGTGGMLAGGGANGGAGGGVTTMRTCTFSDDYTVLTQDDLARVAALNCETVEGTLVLRGSSIVDLSGLETIREIESLGIVLTGLTDLGGLDGLTTATSLSISNNERLSQLELPALTTVTGRFQVEANSGAIQLPSLKSVGEFAIVANPGLTSVRMDALESVDSFWIQGNESLLTLHDLPSLSHLGDVVSIDANPMLAQCEVDAILTRAGVSCFSCTGGNDPNGVCN